MWHWFHYNFLPSNEPWYHGAIWPNVFVILVVAPLGWLWLRSKHLALTTAHKAHAEKLAQILDHLDPDTDGGMQTVLDRLDENTPHGIGAIREDLKHIKP